MKIGDLVIDSYGYKNEPIGIILHEIIIPAGSTKIIKQFKVLWSNEKITDYSDVSIEHLKIIQQFNENW